MADSPNEPWILIIQRRPPFNTNLGPQSRFQGPDWQENWRGLMWFRNWGAVQDFRPEIAKRIKEERKAAWKNPTQYARKPSLKL